jgi:hypothetical protein
MSFLKAPGEDMTVLRHRKGARGGGKAERSLQMIDLFLETRPGYIRESNYRRSYQRTKPFELKRFEQFQSDFETFMHHWNHDLAPDGGASRWQVWERGPDKSLSPPPNFHLIAFASGERHETREWDGGFFKIDNERWLPAEPSGEVYEKLADAKKRADEIPIIVSVLDDETFVFFRLRDETEWREAIRKGTSRQSDRKHQKLLNTLEYDILKDNRRHAADFFERTIRGDGSRPLVLDGLSRTRSFIHPGETPPHAQSPLPQEHGDQATAPASNETDPFGGRDPLDVPMDEMFGPGGIIDKYFVSTPSGYRRRSELGIPDETQHDVRGTDTPVGASDGLPSSDDTTAEDGSTKENETVTASPEDNNAHQTAVDTVPADDLNQPEAADSGPQPQVPTNPPADAAAASDSAPPPQTPETTVQADDADTKDTTAEAPKRRIGFISRRIAGKKDPSER